MSVTFDTFELDHGQRRLFRDGVEVHLSPKALQLLQVLVERAPNAVSKKELFDLLWPDTFVSETNLPGIAVELRSALGDDSHKPRFIRTLHGFGYAFSFPLQPAVERPRVRLLIQGREVPLGVGRHTLGRTARAAVFIDDSSVSREHALIVHDGNAATLSDLGSKNGTYVNGNRIVAPTLLHDRDVIGVGTIVAVFRDGGEAEATVTIHTPSERVDGET